MHDVSTHSDSQKTTAPISAASLLNEHALAPTAENKRVNAGILTIQPKLTVGAPDDPFEREADAVADKVMRMPDNDGFQQLYTTSNPQIQRDEEAELSITKRIDKEELQLQPPEPDFLSLKTPFLERNVFHLWDPQSALGVWQYNLDFFKRFGLDDKWAGKAANLTAPFFINSQLKAGSPNWWEVTDRELNTSSIVGSLPLFSFDADFKNWKPLPFLQKKSLDNVSDPANTSGRENFIQRKCASCEEEEKAQRKPLASFIQRKQSSFNNNVVTSDSVSNQIESTKGSGNSIHGTTKSFMESRFGANFSNVKIHTGNYASQLSKDLNAQAFTVGNDIYFNEGKYSPESSDGKHLLAHELTHTIQQSGSIQRDTNKAKEDSEVIKLQKNISAGEWKEAYQYLNVQWMKVMLDKLNALTESEIDALITNADAAKNAKDSNIGEGGKNRSLAAILSVKSVKKSDWPDADIEIARQKTLTISFDQRKEIITFLSVSKSKAAKKLHGILNKPFLGYTASAYDFSDRFLKHADKLGFDVEATSKTLPTTPWTGDDPDPQSTHTTDTATKSFEQSDIVFFSGHQYAQYKRPGLYTDDSSGSCFNMSAISKKLNKVKLVASTSCATICKDVAKIYADKFPNALVLGYKYSAPLNGGVVSNAFANSLVKKGAIDLATNAGLETVKDSWKTVTTSNAGKEGQPGILSAGNVEFYNGSKWQTAKADSKENDCHYH